MAQGVLDDKSEEKALREERQRQNLEMLNNQLRRNQALGQMEQMQRMSAPDQDDGEDSGEAGETEGGGGSGLSGQLRNQYKKYKERQLLKKKAEEEAAKKNVAEQGAEGMAERRAALKGLEHVGKTGVTAGAEAATGAEAGAAAAGAAAGGAAAGGAAAAAGGTAAAVAAEANPVSLGVTAVLLSILGIILLLFVLLIGILAIYFISCETGLIGAQNCPAGTVSNYQNNTPLTVNEGWVQIPSIPVTGGPIPISGIVAPNLPQVKETIAAKLAVLWNLSRAEGLNWVVTSAYRVGTGSCHNLGEAVDIGLRPVPTPVPGARNRIGRPLYTDPRIARLMELGGQAGFSFVLDEYNYPTGNASGGHVHMSIGGYKYCVDNDQ